MNKKILFIVYFSIMFSVFINFCLDDLSYAGLNNKKIRQPVVQGGFYPTRKSDLDKWLKKFLSKVKPVKLEGELVGLIVPHAGYVYSGQVAAYAYKQIEGKDIDTVILIGPSHRKRFKGVSVGNYHSYKNSFGEVKVNQVLAEELIESDKDIKFLPSAHNREHSLEVQLPFLQKVLKDFKILPLVIGHYDLRTCNKLSEILYSFYERENVIFVVSSDLSHYHNYEKSIRIDKRTIKGIKNLKAESFFEEVQKGQYELCGAGPVTVILSLAELMEDVEINLLNYSNSAEVPEGNTSNVVGYSAMVLTKKEFDMDKKQHSEKQDQNIETFDYLNDKEKDIVLSMAKESIKNYLLQGNIPEFSYPEYSHLKEKRGVFVTIYKNGNLRGCIGRHESDKPLYKLVPEIAIASAFHDRRFSSLKEDELDDIELEVSVYLSKLVEIKDIDEYKLGKHGIILKKGFRGSTFLPKVPIQQGWDKEKTFRHLCYKAGLPVDAWQDENVKFYVYSTQVIKEKNN